MSTPSSIPAFAPRLIPILLLLSSLPGSAQDLTIGRLRFEIRCAPCHGSDGMGGERAPAIGAGGRARLQSERSIRELIRYGIPQSGMPAFPLPESELEQLAAFVRSRIAPAGETRTPGDVKAGQAFFFGSGGCSTCHMLQGRGGLNGPDLTTAGDRLTLVEMERSLRSPNKRRVRGFEVASVALRSGRTVRGFIRNQSGFDLQLHGFDRRLYLLRAGDILSITRETASLMPPFPGTPTDLENVLAFLSHPTSPPPSAIQTAELPDAVRWERVLHPKDGDWPTYHGDIGGNRHSSLKQITRDNVAGLAPKWIFPVSGSKNLEVTPLVIAGVMYVTDVNSVYALDAGTGREIWRFSRARTKGLVGDAASGINRGVAVMGDRVFLVTDNAHLIALHRLTGGMLWDVAMADSHRHYGATSAPLVVNDLVISGVSGGDEGIRGFLAAYKVSTGERVWQLWTVPAPGEPLAATWAGRAIEHGCAATWLTGTYDAESDLLFWVTGNPCPDYNGDERKGDNLYSDSVLALQPRTGELKWHFQFTPHDLHDWDATETPMIVDAQYRGRPRKLLLQGNRNGFFYVLDRASGKMLSASPFVTRLTWATGVAKDGRPILTDAWKPTVQGMKVCPSVEGATNWMSTAFNPETGLFYLMALEKCDIYSKSAEWWKLGESFYGGSTRSVPEELPKKFLRALDVETGKIAWEYPQTGPGNSWAGLLSTSSGLVFFGDDNGAFTAVDGKDGKPLWHFQLNVHWKASPMTYAADGNQYVAVAAGSNIVAFGLP